MIYWSGKSTNGICKWKVEANSFIELFNELMDKEVINDPDEDVYDGAVLKKYGKTFDDKEFLNEDGDLDYNKIQSFTESHALTDEELWILIATRNGNAYYQTFKKDVNDDQVEIDQRDFDSTGKFLF